MKKFELDGVKYECEDKFNFAARDKDGSVFVYEKQPEISGDIWDSFAEIDNVYPISTTRWKDTLVEL